MRRWKSRRRLLLTAVLLIAAPGCYEARNLEANLSQLRADHEALLARYNGLRNQLFTRTRQDNDPQNPGTRETSIVAWGQIAGRAICEIVAENGPVTKYSAATRDICGASEEPLNEPPSLDSPTW
jgi:hypothetical protein